MSHGVCVVISNVKGCVAMQKDHGVMHLTIVAQPVANASCVLRIALVL